MWKITMWLFVGVVGFGFVSSAVTCPDGSRCSDVSTCCVTEHGYACCQYQNAVCCSDLVHCCPSGFHCNQATQMCEKQDQPWMSVPMQDKVAAEEPSAAVLPVSLLQQPDSGLVQDQAREQRISDVHCDSYSTCPSGTTCCRHPQGVWFCCPYTLGMCCLDGVHCCPFGYYCDLTYTHCLMQGLKYPFARRPAASSFPASRISTQPDEGIVQKTRMTALTETSGSVPKAGVIPCDDKTYCSDEETCCKGPTGQWNCCPYPLAQCCTDGEHCCEQGYQCDMSARTCKKGYFQVPAGTKQLAKQN